MPGLYGSRATKFMYIGGAPFTGVDGPLTSSTSEVELLTEKFMPEGARRSIVVQSGISNEIISLEGYARRDSGAANLILADLAHATAAPGDHIVSLGEFGDTPGELCQVHRGMTLAESWKTVPGDILLQFSGTLKTSRGGDNEVAEAVIVRAMAETVGENDTDAADVKARLVDLGAASASGFIVIYHVDKIEFKDRAKVTLGISHSTSLVAAPAVVAAANVVIDTPGADGSVGPLGFWQVTSGAARKFVAPRFAFSGAGTSVLTTVKYHCAVVRI